MLDTMASSENLIAIQQLKDEVENLKKQLNQKEQQLLEKDKKVGLLWKKKLTLPIFWREIFSGSPFKFCFRTTQVSENFV